MLKKVKIIAVIVLLLTIWLVSISTVSAQELSSINLKRQKITNIGMITLGTWAIGNMAGSGIMSLNRQGASGYFHQMNFLWNTVNLGLAASGLYSSMTEEVLLLSLSESLEAQHRLEKILLLNVGLDFAYMTGGLLMMERSRRKESQSQRFLGYGRSLLLQGGFLLLFDCGLYAVLSHQGNALVPLISGLSIRPDGLGFTYRF